MRHWYMQRMNILQFTVLPRRLAQFSWLSESPGPTLYRSCPCQNYKCRSANKYSKKKKCVKNSALEAQTLKMLSIAHPLSGWVYGTWPWCHHRGWSWARWRRCSGSAAHTHTGWSAGPTAECHSLERRRRAAACWCLDGTGSGCQDTQSLVTDLSYLVIQSASFT